MSTSPEVLNDLIGGLIKVIDGEYPRDLWKWFNGLDLMRATHAPRT